MSNAGVAKLADAHGSEPCVRKDLRVQIPPPAPRKKQTLSCFFVEKKSQKNGLVYMMNADRKG